MREAADVEKEWMELKAKYWEKIQSRVRLLDDGGIDGLQQGAEDFSREEEEMFNRSEELRKELMNLAPEKFAFTEKKKTKCTYTDYGDNGYFFCYKCKKIFKADYSIPAERHTHSFSNCEEHATRTSAGEITIRKDVLCGI